MGRIQDSQSLLVHDGYRYGHSETRGEATGPYSRGEGGGDNGGGIRIAARGKHETITSFDFVFCYTFAVNNCIFLTLIMTCCIFCL